MKTLVMAQTFKHSNYVNIVKNLVPDLAEARDPHNLQASLGSLQKDFPTLSNIVVIDKTPVSSAEKGMLPFSEIMNQYSQNISTEDLLEREKGIDPH